MTEYYNTETVLSDLRSNGILIMTINRPDAANALDAKTSEAMEAIMEKAENDPAVRAVIVTGTGRFFCAGQDLKELSETGLTLTYTAHGFGGICERLSSKPLICAINGYALGGGMEIAVACDMAVAAEGALMGLTEAKWGLLASGGGVTHFAREIDRKRCTELILTARKFTAEQAYDYGLVNYVVPADQVLAKAIELAEECVANAPLALKWAKYCIHAANQMSVEDSIRYCDAAYNYLELTEDGIEGPKAFSEKRAPVWVGR